MNRVAVISRAMFQASMRISSNRRLTIINSTNLSPRVTYYVGANIFYGPVMERYRPPLRDVRSWTPCCESFRKLVTSIIRMQGHWDEPDPA